jgi:hypothetical protein
VSSQPGQTDLHRRFEALEKRIAEAMHRLGSRGPVPEHHRARAGEIEETRSAIRKKLAADEGVQGRPGGREAKSEIEKDLEDLRVAFERWVKHLDEEFK